MRAFLSVLLIVLGLFLSPPEARAQGWIDQPFDPAPMSREDIATLQAALAFSGDYYGYTDGVWNTDAQAALEAWVKREEGASRPLYRHLNRLIMKLEDERVKNGWQLFYSESTNTSYLHPFELLKSVDNKDAVEFLSDDSGFSVMVRFTDQPGMKNIHDWFLGQAVQGSDPYQYSDDRLWITSTTIEDDMVAYARSDFYNGSWSTVSIVVWPDYFYHLNLMAASMTVGGSPASLMWTDGGVIDQVINGGVNAKAPSAASGGDGPKDQVRRPKAPGVADMPEPEPEPEPQPDPGGPVTIAGNEPGGTTPPLGSPGPAAPSPGGTTPPLGSPGPAAPTPDPGGTAPPLGSPGPTTPAPGGVIGIGNPGPAPVREPGSQPVASPGATPTPEPSAPREKVSGTLKGSGSGFYIAPTMLVTAAHVVEGCGAMAMVDGTPLDVVAADATLDLAVLGGAPDAGAWLKLSALEVPKLGETVTALGYPYYTSLDQGLTVTSGNVSALRGIDGSSNRVMITAPVQPGNSGGPLLNKKGAVIGVVVSRVDDMAILNETGSLPQNMNFAVPSGPLLTFLAQNRVSRPQGEGTGGDMSVGLPDGVAQAVGPIYCYQ